MTTQTLTPAQEGLCLDLFLGQLDYMKELSSGDIQVGIDQIMLFAALYIPEMEEEFLRRLLEITGFDLNDSDVYTSVSNVVSWFDIANVVLIKNRYEPSLVNYMNDLPQRHLVEEDLKERMEGIKMSRRIFVEFDLPQ